MEDDMNIKRLIGYRIKQLRKTKGLSQEALSEKIGMSPKYLSSIELGKENPTLDMFIKLAQSLGVDIWELFNYSQEQSLKESKKVLLDLIKGSDKEKLELTAKIIRAIHL